MSKPNIQPYLDAIMEAVYGEEVRGSIHDALEAVNNYNDEAIDGINNKIGANNGIASLNASGKVPSSQLPSYVDDVIEGYFYNNKFYEDNAHTEEITPERDKIYVDLATNKGYRWTGTAYIRVDPSEWGDIQGTMANQTDLMNALNKKYDTDDTAEEALADADSFPFYDASESAKRKTLWSNIKSVLKTFFDGIYQALLDNALGWDSSKNELKIPSSVATQTIEGVTFEVQRNEEGQVRSIFISGSPNNNRDVYFQIASQVVIKGDRILSGCPANGYSTYGVYLDAQSASPFVMDHYEDKGSGVLIDSIFYSNIYIVVKNGHTIESSITVRPMIRSANTSSDFEPYKASVSDRLTDKQAAINANTARITTLEGLGLYVDNDGYLCQSIDS